MNFIIVSTKNESANYVKKKLEALAVLHDEEKRRQLMNAIPAILQNGLSDAENPLPRIAGREDFYEVDKRQRLLVEVAERCAIQELAEKAPLIDGEAIEEDFFSYLLESYQDVPAFTAVLKRRTNLADLVYFFDRVKIDRGDIVHIPPPAPVVSDPGHQLLRAGFELNMAFIKKLLIAGGKSAGSAVASKLGVMVLNLVMKEVFGQEDDTQRLIDEMRKVIREEIEVNEITRIEGTINGTLLFLCGEYKNQKAKADLSKVEVRTRLMADLKTYSNKFYTDLIGLLKQEKYAQRGLKTFMFAASVHLLLTQEMALIDPDFMNPNDSGFLLTLRDNATSYKNHVAVTYQNAMEKRNNMAVKSETNIVPSGNRYITTTYWSWRDNVSGETAGGFTESKNPTKTAGENATESLERHRTEVLNNLRKDLGNPQETFLKDIGNFQSFTFPKAS